MSYSSHDRRLRRYDRMKPCDALLSMKTLLDRYFYKRRFSFTCTGWVPSEGACNHDGCRRARILRARVLRRWANYHRNTSP